MEFNTVNFNILGMLPYHFWALIGFTFAICLGMFFYYRSKLNITFAFYSVLLSCIGLFIGSILFGAIYNFITNSLLNKRVDFSSIFKGGIVFYGGLTGFVVVYLFLWRKKPLEIRFDGIDILPLLITGFHSFARIGCFTAGCCYGIITDSRFSVLYTNMINGTEVTQRRIPTQLIESAFEILMFTLVFFLFLRKKQRGKLLWLYLICYSVYRFFAEFLRGDWDRNVFRLLSLSQFYSILVLIISIIFIVRSFGFKSNSKEGKLV